MIETSGHASEHASGPDARSHAAAAGAVRAMLEAKSVALLGASPRPGSLGERMVMEATRSSAQPEIHLVNPRYARMFGRPCLPSIDSIEGPVDLVLLGVPDGALEDQLSRAAARGDRSAVIFSGAFNGSGTEALRDRLATQARGAGMALCGAGCMGFVNVAYGLRALGYIERDPLPNGPVALITHSGSVFSALLRSRRDLGFTLAVSSGQELVTTTADYLEYALSQPATRVVALLLETLRDPSAFRRALDRAARQDVVVVALTVGGSPGGRTMVAAHSGSLAGEDGAWAALFEAHGVIRVADLDEMADTLELFSSPRRAGPTGPQGGIATVHDSGAERALVADMAHRLEVPFATIGEETARRIRELLDPGLEPANPLDLWGNGRDTERLFTDALTAMADDDNVAVVALGVDMVPEYDGDDSYPLAAFEVARRTRKPFAVLNNVASSLDNDAASALRAEGVTVLEGTGSGLLALHHLLEYRDQRSRSLVPSGAHLNQARRTSWLDRLSRGPLSAIDSFALLADYGITPVAAREVASADDAVAAARDFGYPVVLKTADPAHSHKTEVDGVKLGLDDDDMVAAAFLELTRRLGPRVLVASGAPPGVELVVGLARDPLVGPLVVVGAGGVLVELLADRTLGLPPIDAARAARMIDGLRMRPLLDGYRGGVPVDFDAVVGAVVGLSNLAEELGDAIDALDVNPLRCGPGGCLALDVLVQIRDQKMT